MKILFLTNRPIKNTQAETVLDYINSLSLYSKNQIFELTMLNVFPAKLNLDHFDIILIHYTLPIGVMIEHYLGKKLIGLLNGYKGLKAVFLQDEYRQVNKIWENLKKLKIDILFSCVPESEINKVYPKKILPNLKVINVLTGYIPISIKKIEIIPIKNRKIDVGYRSRKMPLWMGDLAYEKSMVASEFKKRSYNSSLKLDFSTSEGDRLYGNDWRNFLLSCKTVLGVESGSSIFDFDGSIEKSVNDYQRKYPYASYDEIKNKFLVKKNKLIKYNQISPRCFEAIAFRTPMILFEGSYSGIIKPGEHFIMLKKDFSNFDDVIKKLKDDNYLQHIANNAYNQIGLDKKWSYKKFVNKIDDCLEVEFKKRKKIKINNEYTLNEFGLDVKSSFNYRMDRIMVLKLQSKILGNKYLRKIIFSIWEALPFAFQKKIRPFAKVFSR